MILRTLFQQPGLHFNLHLIDSLVYLKGNYPYLRSFDDNRFVGWMNQEYNSVPSPLMTWAAVKKVTSDEVGWKWRRRFGFITEGRFTALDQTIFGN
jgi:hypothetical protein